MLPGWDGGQGGLGIDGRYKIIHSDFSDLANNTSAGCLALLLLLVRRLATSSCERALPPPFSLTFCLQGSLLQPPRPVNFYASLQAFAPSRNTSTRIQRVVPPRRHTLLAHQKRRPGLRCYQNPIFTTFILSQTSSELWDGFGDASGVGCKLMMGLTLLPIARRSVWLDSAAAGFAEGIAFHRATGWWCVVQIVIHWITYTLKDV